MEFDPEKINDADRQIEATIFKQGQDYADRNQRSKVENKGRAESRAKIREIGMDPNAYATAIRLIKDKSPEELKAWKRDFDLTLKVMGTRQKELFPEEALKAEKREADRKAKKAEAKAKTREEVDANADANPRSDPASGGAGRPSEEDMSKAAAAVDPEQAEGDAALKAGLPKTRKAQSAVAKEKLEAAKFSGLN